MKRQVAPPGGDRNTGPEQEAVSGLFMSISIVLVILRFYVRTRIVKKLWWDDFFLMLGMLFSIVGFGLTVAKTSFALKMENIATPFLILSTMFTKISFCLFLLRIFMNNRVWKRAIYIIIALIAATNISSAIIVLPQCKPAAKLWNPNIKGTCWPRETQIGIAYYQGGISIFTDFLLVLLPIYFLKDIQISFRTKVSICALMSLGVFTGICAIIRTALLSQLKANDITYSETNLNHWASLEKNFAIIAAAIPALRPLWASKNAKRNPKTSEQARRLDEQQRLKPTYVVMDQQLETDSCASRLETRITAQGGRIQGDVGSEATSLPDCNGIMKTSDVSLKNFRKFEGKWLPEHSSLSDRESIEEAV